MAFSKEGEEVFYDLPLDVSGSGTLQKSLDRCVVEQVRKCWGGGEMLVSAAVQTVVGTSSRTPLRELHLLECFTTVMNSCMGRVMHVNFTLYC